MHPCALICIRHTSVYTRVHTYASKRLIYAPERKCSTHVFAKKLKKYNNKTQQMDCDQERNIGPSSTQIANAGKYF